MQRRISIILSFFVILVTNTALAQSYGNEWINPNQEYFKVQTARDGIYRISYSDLQAAGFPLGTDPRRIRMYHRGEEVAIHIQGQEDARFDSGDYIEFYGQKNDGTLDAELYQPTDAQVNPYLNLFSDTTAYFLTYSLMPENGKRMAYYKENNTGGLTAAPYHIRRAVESYMGFHSRGMHYPINANGRTILSKFDEAEGFQTTSFGNGGAIDLALEGLMPVSGADITPRLLIKILGKSSGTHDFTITAGGVVKSFSFYGWGSYKAEVDLTSGDLQSGTLDINVRVNSNNGDYIGVSYVELVFAERFAQGGQAFKQFTLPASGSGKSYISVSQAPSVPQLLDITDPSNITRIGLNNSNGTYDAVIRDTDTERILLSAGSDYYFPVIKSVELNPLAESSFEYIIITHSSLHSSSGSYADPVEAYADYRRSSEGGNYDALILDIDDLYDRFSFGERTPLAIYNAVRYMHENGDPRFLFFIGKSMLWHTNIRRGNQYTYYRNEPSLFAKQNLVPTAGSPGSDDAFSAPLSETGLTAAIPTGRLNASTPAEVANYLDKVKEMEAKPYSFLWRKHLLHLSGGIDDEQSIFLNYMKGFESTAESVFLGGKVTTISKQTNNTVEAINISDEINKGQSMVTFFGHSAPSVTDIEIGFVTDPALNYNNKGKYPLFLVNGCEAGDIFSQSTTFGEDWILARDKGAIGFMAHSDLGYASLLKLYSDIFYQVAFSEPEFLNSSIGEIKMEVTKRFIRLAPPIEQARAQAQQIVLQGDPAYRLFGAQQPDYDVDSDFVYLQSETGDQVVASDNSFKMAIPVRNFGRAVSDSLTVWVTRTLSNNSAQPLQEYIFPPLLYADTLYIEFDASQTENFGNNRFEVVVDPEDRVEELDETNNRFVFEAFIPRSGTINLLPAPYAIVNQPQVKLVSQSGAIEDSDRRYIFEADTSFLFDSPVKLSGTIESTQLASFTMDLPVTEDSTVYYWRTRFEETQPGEVNDWTTSSFAYISGNASGWAQLEFPQINENNSEGLFAQSFQRNWTFKAAESLLEIKTYGNKFEGFSADLYEVKINGLTYILDNRICQMNTHNLIAFDRSTAQPYLPDNINYSSLCGRLPQVITTYRNEYVIQDPQITTFIDAVKDGDYVLLFLTSGPRIDYPAEVIAKFEEIGVSTESISDLVRGEPLIIIGQKGTAPGSATIVRADPESTVPVTEQSISYTGTIIGNGESGTIYSPLIGPSLSWAQAMAQFSEAGENDRIAFDIIGLTKDLQEDVLYTRQGGSLINLSASPETYPYMRMKAEVNDNVDRTPAQLKKWMVTYTPAPEGILLARNNQSISVQEGEEVTTEFSFINLTEQPFEEPFTVRGSLYNSRTGKTEEQEISLPAPGAYDTLTFNLTWDTRGMPGANNLLVEANSERQPEQNYNNNINNIIRAINVEGDFYQPVLEVTFDGRAIQDMDVVASRPLIELRMIDENKAWLKQDTLGTQLLLMPDCDTCSFKKISFSHPDLIWRPATESTPFYVSYLPDHLEDGTYRLRFIGSDAAGNALGPEPYEIRFRVSSEPSIVQMAPYPNPFTHQVYFPFRITGKEYPDVVLLQIYSSTGHLVKEINVSGSDAGVLGDHEITLSWDGTDHIGKMLAPGLYIYRFSIRHQGAELPAGVAEPGENLTQGTGKIILTR